METYNTSTAAEAQEQMTMDAKAARRDEVLAKAHAAYCECQQCIDPAMCPLEMFGMLLSDNAYHEAGHIAVTAFVSPPKATFFSYGTIIISQAEPHPYVILTGPTGSAEFCMSSRRLLWEQGFQAMVCDLAGCCAQHRSRGLLFAHSDWSDYGDYPCEPRCDHDPDTPSCPADMMSVRRVADLLANKTWPNMRIIYKAIELTEEILEIPEVWCCVENVADMFLEYGSLDSSRVKPLYEPICGLAWRLPKWRRRFSAMLREMPFLATAATGDERESRENAA